MPAKPTTEIGVYGLSACDSCRKAQQWLKSHRLDFRFFDLRVDAVDSKQLDLWLQSSFAAHLLNQRSTTWRKLSSEDRALADTDLKRLLSDQPALIKRPVFTRCGRIVAVGFKPEALEMALMS